MLELLLGRASERARPVHAPVPEPASGAVARLTRAWGERQRRRARWLRSAARQVRSDVSGGLRDGLRANARRRAKARGPRGAAPDVERAAGTPATGQLSELPLARAGPDPQPPRSATSNDALLALLAGGLQRFLDQARRSFRRARGHGADPGKPAGSGIRAGRRPLLGAARAPARARERRSRATARHARGARPPQGHSGPGAA